MRCPQKQYVLAHAAHDTCEPLRETESPTSMPAKPTSLGVVKGFAVKEREHRETDAQVQSIDNSVLMSSYITHRMKYFARTRGRPIIGFALSYDEITG